MLTLTHSQAAFKDAQALMPGGVNSPVRSYGRVRCTPPFIASAKGSSITDIDGNTYIDYVGSWGPMIAGHAHPRVVKALQEAAARGTSYGAPTLLESEIARLIKSIYPSIEKLRMVNSGTEATMSALRVARGFTGCDKIIKFQGCYHGHADSLLVSAGSGAATFGQPDSPGVPAATAADTITLPYNDSKSFNRIMDGFGNDIAAVIVEPVAGNMGLVLPEESFLQALRSQTQAHGAILIFDEVMCGFRTALHGAQAYYGITPDMTCLGKIIGGGMPVGAFGGRRDVMDALAPTGPVYQAGTLSGNPIAMAAGFACLNEVAQPGVHETLDELTTRLAEGLLEAAEEAGIPLVVNHVGGMFGIFFTDAESVTCYQDVMACDVERFKRFFHMMLDEGVYLAPSAFEAGFMSVAHSMEDINNTIDAARRVFAKL